MLYFVTIYEQKLSRTGKGAKQSRYSYAILIARNNRFYILDIITTH